MPALGARLEPVAPRPSLFRRVSDRHGRGAFAIGLERMATRWLTHHDQQEHPRLDRAPGRRRGSGDRHPRPPAPSFARSEHQGPQLSTAGPRGRPEGLKCPTCAGVVRRARSPDHPRRAHLVNPGVAIARKGGCRWTPVTVDKDMRQIAKYHGVGSGRFKRLHLLQFRCSEVRSISRAEAITLIEHEWSIPQAKAARRFRVEIGGDYIRTHR